MYMYDILNRAVESIVHLYQWAGRQMLVKPNRINSTSVNQPWWDEECSHAKYLKYSALRRFRVTYFKHDYCNNINLRKTFKSLCLHKKIAYQNSERNKLVSARNNPKTFWSILKQILVQLTRLVILMQLTGWGILKISFVKVINHLYLILCLK